jgi:hypothetical protein
MSGDNYSCRWPGGGFWPEAGSGPADAFPDLVGEPGREEALLIQPRHAAPVRPRTSQRFGERDGLGLATQLGKGTNAPLLAGPERRGIELQQRKQFGETDSAPQASASSSMLGIESLA